MRDTVIKDEVIGVPVFQAVGLPAKAVVQHKVVVRPFQPLADTTGETEDLHHLVVAQDTDGQVGVGLTGIVTRKAQRSRLLTKEPGFRKAGRDGRVVSTVGLETESQVLGVAQRNRPPGTLVEETTRREVVETHTDGSHEGVHTPTAGQFQLAGRLFRYIINNIDRVGILVRNQGITLGRVGNGFRVELAQGSDFTDGPFEIRLAEQVTGLGEDLSADNPLVGQVVTIDDNVVQGCLLALGDAHFYIHRVMLDIHFHRRHVKEQVTVVAVEFGYVVIGLLSTAVETLLHSNHVVGIALVDLEDRVQLVCRIDGVAGPGNVAEIVFVPFRHDQVDSQFVGLDIINGIPDQTRVTITGLVEGAHEPALVVLEFLFVELLAAEEVIELCRLGLLHRLGQFPVGNILIADKVDGLDFDFLATVHREIHADGALDHGIPLLLGRDLALQETLLGIEPLDDIHGGLGHILGILAATTQLQALHEFLFLAALHAGKGPGRHPGTFFDDDDKPGGIALGAQAVHRDGHILKIALGPQTGHHTGNRIAGDRQFHSLLHAGKRDDSIRIHMLVSIYPDSSDNIFLWIVIIYLDPALIVLSPNGKGGQQPAKENSHPISIVHSIHHSNVQIYESYLTLPYLRSRRAYSASASRKASFRKSGHRISVK